MFMQKTLKIKLKSEEASSKWDKLIALRDDVNKALEEARKNKVNGLIYVNAIDWQNTHLKSIKILFLKYELDWNEQNI